MLTAGSPPSPAPLWPADRRATHPRDVPALWSKQTLRPAWCIEQYPKAVEAMIADGHEVAHHGYIHEHPNEMPKDESFAVGCAGPSR
jgi:hypothetical protein